MRSASARVCVRTVDALAGSCVAFGVPLLVLQQTHSTTWAGLSFATEWIPRLMAIGAAAPWVDRLGARTAVLYAASARTVVVLVALAAVACGGAWPLLTALAAVSGVLAQVTSVATASLIADAARRANAGGVRRVQVLKARCDQSVLLVGPMLAGFLASGGALWLLATTAALSAVAVAIGAALPSPGPATVSCARRRPGLRTGAAVMRACPALMWATVAGFGANVLAAVVEGATPVQVAQTYHRAPASTGLVWMVAAMVALVAMALISRAACRWGLWAMTCATTALTGAGALTAAMAPRFAVYAVGVAVIAAAEQGIGLLLDTARTRLIPPEHYASTVSLGSLSMLAPFPAAGLVISAAGRTHLPELLLACGALATVVAVVSLYALHPHRRELEQSPVSRLPAALAPPQAAVAA